MITKIKTDNYVLVKDKDGQLKYYKDGKFYSLEEIDLARTPEPVASVKKEPTRLKPVFTLETKKKSQPLKSAVSLTEEKSLKSRENQVRRSQDQKVIDAKVQHIIDKFRIRFSDGDIKRRFINVLTTYFRGIRTAKEIEYILTLPKISGGLELPEEKAGLIISVLEHHTEDIHKQRRQISQEPSLAVQPVADFEHQLEPPAPVVFNRLESPLAKFSSRLSSLKDDGKAGKKSGNQENSVAAMHELPKEKTVVQPLVVRPIQTVAAARPKMARPAVVKPVPSSAKATEGRQAAAPAPRPKVEDISARRGLVGPVEELGYMTVIDFRRLGKDQEERSEEVLEKIQLLADQSLNKKVEGINAWKKSPLFSLYLEISMRAVQEKNSIDQVIERKQAANEETLTLSEFEAVSELNRKLLF